MLELIATLGEAMSTASCCERNVLKNGRDRIGLPLALVWVELNDLLLGEFLYAVSPQGGDPIEAFHSPKLFVDALGGDHAPVTDEDDALESEAFPHLFDLGRERTGIAGVALEDLDGNRTTGRIA